MLLPEKKQSQLRMLFVPGNKFTQEIISLGK